MRRDASWVEVAIDSVEEMGLGLVTAGLMLFLLGRITSEMELNEIVGKLVMEAMTVAIGVSIGTSQLGVVPPPMSETKVSKKARRRRRRTSATSLSLLFAVQCSCGQCRAGRGNRPGRAFHLGLAAHRSCALIDRLKRTDFVL